MAVTTDVWRHDGNNSWNDLVRRVNDVLQNPDPGCDPEPPLPEVAEGHKWSVQDITNMQNALKKVCKDNVFTPVESMDKWEKFIIDELETALAAGWCDCEECIPTCDNAIPDQEIFLLSKTLTTCTGEPANNCSAQANNSQTLFSDYLNLKDVFETSYREYCVLVEEAEDLDAQKTAACNIDPGSPTCIALTAQLAAKEAERDAKLAEALDDIQTMLSKAAETVSNAAAALDLDGDTPFITLVQNSGLNEPWTNWECDDPLRIPVCSGFNIDHCMVVWSLQVRTSERIQKDFFCAELPPDGGLPSAWFTILSGESAVDGGLVVKPFGACVSVPDHLCFSTNCSGGSCPPCPTVLSLTQEYRLLVNYPFPLPQVTCNTGQSCTP